MALFFCWSTSPVRAQLEPMEIENDDLNLGGNDIFNDFKEDYEDTKVLEDENFYQYARFYNVALTIGHTMFDGNRGSAYVNEPPTFGLSLNYFINSWSLNIYFSIFTPSTFH